MHTKILRIIFLLFLFAGIISCKEETPEPEHNFWKHAASFTGDTRSDAVAFSLNGKGYVYGGWGDNIYKSDFWEFIPELDVWLPTISLPESFRYKAISFVINDTTAYVGLGGYFNQQTMQDTLFKDVWAFSNNNYEWKRMATFPGKGRTGAVAFTIDTMAYIGLGNCNDTLLSDFWAYNAKQNLWQQLSNFPAQARSGATAFAINGKGFVTCGQGKNFTVYNDLWEYNPTTDSWIRKADFRGEAREGLTSFVADNNAFVGLGWSPNGLQNDFYKYEPHLNLWTKMEDFAGAPRMHAVSFSIFNKGYCGLGYLETDFFIYTP